MFLNLNHYNLDVYKAAKELRKQCYKTIRFLPDAEKYNLIVSNKKSINFYCFEYFRRLL